MPLVLTVRSTVNLGPEMSIKSIHEKKREKRDANGRDIGKREYQ